MTRIIMKSAIVASLALGLTFGSASTFAADAISLDALLEQVKQGRVKDAAENKKRIAEFQSNPASRIM